MNVVVDARMALHTGIGRYIRSLCRALLRQSDGVNLSLLLNARLIEQVQQEIGPVETIPFSAQIYSFAEQFQSLWLYRAQAKGVSLFHYPHYNVPWFLPRNSVVTIHDLTHFQFHQPVRRYRVTLAFRLLQRAVHRAGHLIVISQATRDTLENWFPAARGKTTVIYHGVAKSFAPLVATDIELFKRVHRLGRFFLYVGNAKPHKNLPRLLQAFAPVRAEFPHVALLLIGVDATKELGPMDGVHMLPSVSDAQLVRYYNAAEVLLLPSLNEGFGLTALEAMACGTPVIGSKIAALEEVVGNAGLLVDPLDVGALSKAMHQLLTTPQLRDELRQLGLARAPQFAWSRAAEQTLQVYTKVATLSRLAGCDSLKQGADIG